ncbi:3'-5' exonuclease [Paenibacillus sp.]|uniref:3'-5' exonuclease n=1 Tax=Paenibacillus sp. TaxID=58172 RepID=UPI002811B3C8|nr:3'-5' exonuclease [Paenibacillus sp.]
MAYMVPNPVPARATAGERMLFETLRTNLPEDYIVYYEPEIDGRRPSAVVIGPDLGLIVLEVADYTSRSLYRLGRDEWSVWSASGEKVSIMNPLDQARDHARGIADRLKQQRVLTEANGARLKFAIGYGTVFPRMSQAEFLRYRVSDAIDTSFALCRDELDPEDEGFAPDALYDKIQGMFPSRRKQRIILSREDLRAIRSQLVPEARSGAALRPPFEVQDQLLLSAHPIDPLDHAQEQLARALGDRHRLIRGAAGSGKTLVLANRARLLAKQHPDWRILVLCSGLSLSRSLEQTIDRMMEEPEDLFDFPNDPNDRRLYRVEVYNFREWLRNELRTKEEDIPTLLRMTDRGEAILPSYDAILIDEGQEFEPEWLRLVSTCLNPRTQSLLLVEDSAQSMFRRKKSLAQNTGLDFRGRSKILAMNYRNSMQIVQFAWDFFQAQSPLRNRVKHGSVEGVDMIPPQAAKRRGPDPIVKRFSRLKEEMDFVSESIAYLHDVLKIPYADIAILYRVKNSYNQPYIDDIRDGLKRRSLPYAWVSEDAEPRRDRNDGADGAIRISTIDGAKETDYRAVFIVNLESMPFSLEEAEEREVSLLYIGMTRALDWLFLTYSGESKFTAYVEEAAKRRSESTSSHRSG